jgi:hypothetical protein
MHRELWWDKESLHRYVKRNSLRSHQFLFPKWCFSTISSKFEQRLKVEFSIHLNAMLPYVLIAIAYTVYNSFSPFNAFFCLRWSSASLPTAGAPATASFPPTTSNPLWNIHSTACSTGSSNRYGKAGTAAKPRPIGPYDRSLTFLLSFKARPEYRTIEWMVKAG